MPAAHVQAKMVPQTVPIYPRRDQLMTAPKDPGNMMQDKPKAEAATATVDYPSRFHLVKKQWAAIVSDHDTYGGHCQIVLHRKPSVRGSVSAHGGAGRTFNPYTPLLLHSSRPGPRTRCGIASVLVEAAPVPIWVPGLPAAGRPHRHGFFCAMVPPACLSWADHFRAARVLCLHGHGVPRRQRHQYLDLARCGRRHGLVSRRRHCATKLAPAPLQHHVCWRGRPSPSGRHIRTRQGNSGSSSFPPVGGHHGGLSRPHRTERISGDIKSKRHPRTLGAGRQPTAGGPARARAGPSALGKRRCDPGHSENERLWRRCRRWCLPHWAISCWLGKRLPSSCCYQRRSGPPNP